MLFSIPLLAATGLATLRFGPLPRWLGWFSLALALLLAIPTLGFLGLVAGLPIWTVLVAVLLFRQPSA